MIKIGENKVKILPNQSIDLDLTDTVTLYKDKEVLFKLKSEKGKTVFKSYQTFEDAIEGLEHAIETEKQNDFYIKVEFK